LNKENTNISALIITYNEVNHIHDVIANISFADEIIVVDSFSTDGTYETLKELHHVNVIQRDFENFADQRNFAITKATCEWILFIDADERLTPELQDSIQNATKKQSDTAAYKIKRHFMFNQKMMRFSGLQTDVVLRFFKNGTASYREDIIVHEQLDIKGEIDNLDGFMLHYSFSGYKSYKKKTEHYGKLKAQELFKKGTRPNWFHYVIKPIYKFLINYIFRLGFLDGPEGYVICKLNAYGVHFRYKELKKLRSTSSPKQ